MGIMEKRMEIEPVIRSPKRETVHPRKSERKGVFLALRPSEVGLCVRGPSKRIVGLRATQYLSRSNIIPFMRGPSAISAS